jgi:uncharacterized membrane protein
MTQRLLYDISEQEEATMNSSSTSNDPSSNNAERMTPRADRTSTKEHLMRKAQQCELQRDKYITKLGDAQGNDVFKYLLLLNCIDCQGYVTEIQLQAHNSFRWSTFIACAGFFLLTVFAIAAGASKVPQLHMQDIELAWITGISGVITTFISTIFFYLYSRALKRLDEFHTQLREIQRIVSSLFLSGLIQQSDQGDQERKEIIGLLLSELGRLNQREVHITPKHQLLQPA